MNKKIFVALVFVAVTAFMFPQVYAISWKYNLDEALKLAKSQHKPVMVDFYTDWCGWCKKLDRDTYADRRVNAAAEEFICVKINAEKQRALSAKYGVTGFPTIIFLDSGGGVLLKVPGYLPPEKFLANMNKILSAAPKPSAGIEPKPAKEGGGFNVVEDRVAGKKDKNQAVKTVNQEFVYNGYIESGGGDFTAQINYKGSTYFVKKGDSFEKFQVISADKDKVILGSDKDEITLEYKKPYGGGGLLDEISRMTVHPAGDGPSAGKVDNEGSFQETVKANAINLSVSIAILLIFYIFYALCLQLMAKKTNTPNSPIAWVPVLNFFLMLNIARIKYRVVVMPLIIFFALIIASYFAIIGGPLAGLIFAGTILSISVYFVLLIGYIWYKIAVARGKRRGPAVVLTIMMFVFPLNLIAMGYLAFSK